MVLVCCRCNPFLKVIYVEFKLLTSFLPSHSDELRKEARQLKKELQAIKQRREESSKPAVDEAKEGM